MRLRMPVLMTLALTLLAPGSLARETTPLAVDGFPLAVSRDGTSVAGVEAGRDRFCVWDLATLAGHCDGDLPAPVEARSVTWAPDGSAVAFSLGASNRLVDSDIHVFDIAEGTLRNLTEDPGADDVSFLMPAGSPVAIDVYPAWSPDGTAVLFARTMWRDPATPGVTLMSIPREGGEPEVYAELAGIAPLAVTGPMHWREDGSILLTTRHPDPADPSNAIRLLSPDRTLAALVDGSAAGPITDPVLASISPDGTAVSAWARLDFHEGLWARETPVFFHVDVGSGTATPWYEVPGVNLPDGARLIAPAAFGPDGSVAILWRVRGGEMGVSVRDGSGAFRTLSPVTYAAGGTSPANVNGLTPSLQWAGDRTLLLILATGGTLIPTGVESASPAATPAG